MSMYIKTHPVFATRKDDEIQALQARIAELETALQHYDQALLIAFPEGAEGRVFDHWNKARSALRGRSEMKIQIKDRYTTPPTAADADEIDALIQKIRDQALALLSNSARDLEPPAEIAKLRSVLKRMRRGHPLFD